MRTGPNFIPTGKSKKDTALRRQTLEESDRHMSHSSLQQKITENRRRENREKNHEEHLENQRRIWAEVANNILSSPLGPLSLSNPEWYPPVPEYTPPEGRRLSTQEIQLAHSGKSNNPNDVSENFGETSVWISNTPITLEEWELYNVASFPYVSPRNFHTHLQSLKTIQGYTIRDLYSYPNIIEKVKWYVTFCCTEKGDEILGIYCFNNKQAIDELMGFLIDTPVQNETDKFAAVGQLAEQYTKLS